MKTLSLCAAAAFAFALSPAASAQTAMTPVAECGPVEGTIRVADDDQVTPDMARVSLKDARTALVRAVPGAMVTGLELDEEDGFLVYEADLWRGNVKLEAVVDAGSGEVLCLEED